MAARILASRVGVADDLEVTCGFGSAAGLAAPAGTRGTGGVAASFGATGRPEAGTSGRSWPEGASAAVLSSICSNGLDWPAWPTLACGRAEWPGCGEWTALTGDAAADKGNLSGCIRTPLCKLRASALKKYRYIYQVVASERGNGSAADPAAAAGPRQQLPRVVQAAKPLGGAARACELVGDTLL